MLMKGVGQTQTIDYRWGKYAKSIQAFGESNKNNHSLPKYPRNI